MHVVSSTRDGHCVACVQAPPAFKKRVRWADDVDDEDENIGFSIGGASRQQVGLPHPMSCSQDHAKSSDCSKLQMKRRANLWAAQEPCMSCGYECSWKPCMCWRGWGRQRIRQLLAEPSQTR